MHDRDTDNSAGAQPESGVEPTPAIRYVYCPRTGAPIPIALAEKRVARQRELNAPIQRAIRAKKRAAEAAAVEAVSDVDMADVAATLADLDMPDDPLTPENAQAQRFLLKKWLEIDGPRQRQHRKQAQSYMTARLVLLRMRWESGCDPEPAEFAPRLATALREPVDRDRARNTLNALAKLEGEGGPWEGTPS
ncbi:MAG: hypothetical protein PGN25_07365 [Methylorubrum populi]